MQLTEVRINLCSQRGSRLKAFCSLTFDDTFVVRDVKLIDGVNHMGVVSVAKAVSAIADDVATRGMAGS